MSDAVDEKMIAKTPDVDEKMHPADADVADVDEPMDPVDPDVLAMFAGDDDDGFDIFDELPPLEEVQPKRRKLGTDESTNQSDEPAGGAMDALMAEAAEEFGNQNGPSAPCEEGDAKDHTQGKTWVFESVSQLLDEL